MKTKMISTIMLIVIMLMIDNILAANATKNDKIENQAIAKVLPEEFNNYKKELKGDHGRNDANITLNLVTKANDFLKENSDPNKQEFYNKAYYETWCLCIGITKKTKDPEVKKNILEKWNSSLKKDDITVPYQIYAIAYNGWDPNRSFLTEDFWKLLKQTKRKKTISAIGLVLYQYGNPEDADRLMEKRKSGIDIESQEIIQNAINHMNYRFIGDRTNPGPAAGPPRMDMKSEVIEPNSPIEPIDPNN